MKPIPVEERLPALDHADLPGKCSKPVLAFDKWEQPINGIAGAWCLALYRKYDGDVHLNGVKVGTEPFYAWELDTYGVSGYEWETEPINVTHWLPLPDAPEGVNDATAE